MIANTGVTLMRRHAALNPTLSRLLVRTFSLVAAAAALGGCQSLHTNSYDEALALAEQVRSVLHPLELYISEFTRVMREHTGPGLLGFAYYSDP